MVQGPRTKTRKTPSHHLDYVIHIQEIKPWPPSQSLKTIRAVVIQWEHGDRNSGFTNQVAPSVEAGSSLGDGKIEFNESFKLPVTLTRDISMKSGNGNNFQKNCVEFNLYEPRRDKTVRKGQVIGTAVLDMAEYGVVKESFGISVPLNCKRTYSNSAQPLLFLQIQSIERTRAGSSSREGLTREGSSAFEEYVEEAEVASCTTDDDVSSQSSVAVTLAAVELNESSSPQNKNNGIIAVNGSTRELKSVEDQVTKVNEGDFHENDGNYDTANYLNDQEIEKYQKHAKSNADPSNGLSRANVQNQATLENVNGTFFNIDRTKNVKSVRSSLESSRNKDAKMYLKEPNHGLSDSRVELLERRMRILEGELREAAAIEVSLYSVIAEHISSVNKVHAPARRLSRLYFHASKQNSKSRQGSAAKSIVSGLVLVSKACGNDVPRLTFWLSNSIVLRVIISKLFGDDKLPMSVEPVNETTGNGNQKSSTLKWDSFPSKSARSTIEESFGDWENPLTFVVALEKVEAWIFSRIIESIWWQTFTPHMQSSNAKEIRRSLDSESSMSYRGTSIDQQQGNLSLELWKKAFRDACERICPVRAGGHDCGCLLMLSRVMALVFSITATMSRASTNTIRTLSVSETTIKSRCTSLTGHFIVLEAKSSIITNTLRKRKPYGFATFWFSQQNKALVVCRSRFPARAYAEGGSDSSENTQDPEDDVDDDDDDYGIEQSTEDTYGLSLDSESQDDDSIQIEIEKTGKNSRRIRSKVAIRASLQAVWDILTDYERLADFIPGLAVSKLLDKRENFARLFQIGEQDLAFGLKFNAKGTIDCFEKDLETLPFGQKRDIEFKMVEGDFQLFEGVWSVEQGVKRNAGDLQNDSKVGQEFQTTLLYIVNVKPKVWLHVRLVEGRLCKEIRTNLSCIRKEAEKPIQNTPSAS